MLCPTGNTGNTGVGLVWVCKHPAQTATRAAPLKTSILSILSILSYHSRRCPLRTVRQSGYQERVSLRSGQFSPVDLQQIGAVIARGDAEAFFESAYHIVAVRKSAAQGDFGHAQ